MKYNLERAKSGTTSRVKAEQASVASVEATGPHEVTIRLTRPDSPLVLTLADRSGMMVSPTAVEAKGADFAFNPVGTGPFEFVRYLPGDRLELKRFDGYWQAGKPYLDSMTMRFMTDSQTGNNALLAGETDFRTRIEAADIDALRATSGIEASTSPSLYTWICYFNTAKAPFSARRRRGSRGPTTSMAPTNCWSTPASTARRYGA